MQAIEHWENMSTSVAGMIYCTKQAVVQPMQQQTLENVADCCAFPCMKL